MALKKGLKGVRLENADDVFLISEYDTQDTLFMKLINVKKQEAFSGEISVVDLESRASKLRLSVHDYKNKTAKALVESGWSETIQFRYCLENEESEPSFKWKSVDSEGTIIHLGAIKLQKIDSTTVIVDSFQSLSKELARLAASVSRLECRLGESETLVSDTLEKLSSAVETKKEMEKEMYAKFSQVLNEKKRRIRELEGNCKTSSVPKITKKQNFPRKPRQAISSSSSSDEMKVDDPLPSTSRDDSLLFSDEEKPVFITKARSSIRVRQKNLIKNTNTRNKVHEEVVQTKESDDDSCDLLENM